MRKVLCSIGAGPHAELLQITGPTFERYAKRHGYAVELSDQTPSPERYTPWGKIVLIQRLLERNDLDKMLAGVQQFASKP